MFLHYVENLKITISADFNGVLHVRPQNSSGKIGVAQVWILWL